MAYHQIKQLCRKLQITVRPKNPYVQRLQDYMHYQKKQDGKIGLSSLGKLMWLVVLLM